MAANNNDDLILTDGYMPRINYNLCGGGRIDYDDQVVISLFKHFSKYEQVSNELIVDYYISTINENTNRGNFKVTRDLILKHYNIIEEEKNDDSEIDLSNESDEPESDQSDSDDEYSIPVDAQVIDLDQYEEPVDVDNYPLPIQDEATVQLGKRNRNELPIADEPENKLPKNDEFCNINPEWVKYITERRKLFRNRLVMYEPLPAPIH